MTAMLKTGLLALFMMQLVQGAAFAFTPLEKSSQVETVLQGQKYCGYSLDYKAEQDLFKRVGITVGKATELAFEYSLTTKVIEVYEDPSKKDGMCRIARSILWDLGFDQTSK